MVLRGTKRNDAALIPFEMRHSLRCRDDAHRRLRQEGRCVAQAEKKDVAKGVPAPSIEQAKAIAEQGFIYGLPLVMNYAVMYEYRRGQESGQFKAPFNQIHNDTASPRRGHGVITPNSDTPYSFSGWTCARSRWCFRCRRGQEALLLGADDRRQYVQLWLHRQSRNGSDAGDYLIVGPDWKGKRRPESRRCLRRRRRSG
jgi:hypothetical protein